MFWGVLVWPVRSCRSEVLGGRGFGLLDGSLGLVAAACARLGLMLLRSGVGNDQALADARVWAGVLRSVIFEWMVASLAAGIVAWLWVADSRPAEFGHGRNGWPADAQRVRNAWD